MPTDDEQFPGSTLPPQPDLGPPLTTDIAVPAPPTSEEIATLAGPSFGQTAEAAPTPETIDPESAEEVGEVALGTRQIPVVEPPEEPTEVSAPAVQPAEMQSVVAPMAEATEPQPTSVAPELAAEPTPEAAAELSPEATSLDKVLGPEDAEVDPEITLAGDKAEKKLRDGLPGDMSPEETKVIDALASRVRSSAEAEALAEKDKSPESLVFGKLDKIKARLVEAGLTEDAELVAGQIERLHKVIDAATEVIDDPKELELFERDQNGAHPDISRLNHLLNKAGAEDRRMIYYVPLSTDLGEGRRRDRSGTWYNPDDVDKYQDQIEIGGGLEPVLSPEAIAIVLEEGEIKGAEESLESLQSDTARPGLEQNYYYRDLASGGNVQLAAKTPGEQHLTYRLESREGRIEQAVYVRLNPDFVIDAALRRIKAKQ